MTDPFRHRSWTAIVSAFVLVGATSVSLAEAGGAQQPCAIHFAVVWKDSLNNVRQGLRDADRRWVETKTAKKYPELCYDQGAPPIALWINVDDATYHGTRAVSHTNSDTSPIHGTVTDSNPSSPTYGQEVGEVHGQVTTETTTTQQVPYSFDYNVMTMSIEQRQADGSWKVMHNFRHDTIQRRWYGVAISNRHPNQQLIESALKWIHDGGLTDSRQSVLVPVSN